MGKFARSILTEEARSYIEIIGTQLRYWAKAAKFQPIDEYAFLDMWFILPRTNADASNYGKVLFDTLERGGIFTNDRYILPRWMGVYHNAKDPQAIVKLPISREVKIERL